MSGAATGAATGAASGAATGTAILPGWGTAIGAVVGGASGYLGGSSADKKKKKEAAARRRLAAAMARYGQRTTEMADRTTGIARQTDQQYRDALTGHLTNAPDMAPVLRDNIASEQTALQMAQQPAFAPLPTGQSGAERQWAARYSADTQRRASEGAAPLAFQGGARRTASADQDYRNALGSRLAALGLTVDQAGRLQSLQQTMDHEALSGANAQYGVDRARAQTAGSGDLLASQLIQMGGNALGGAYMGGAFQGRPAMDADTAALMRMQQSRQGSMSDR